MCRRDRLKALATLALIAPLSGCGLIQLANLLPTSGASSGAVPNYTGNYALVARLTASGAAPTPVSAIYGGLANTGSSFSAVFRLVTSNACVSPTQDITFTGTRDSVGEVTLASTNLPANPIAITLLEDPTTSGTGIGNYTITGAGPCAMPLTDFGSDQFLPITGTFSGAMQSTTGAIITGSATVAQASAADADGLYPETGTLTVTSATCVNTFMLSNVVVTGPTIYGTLTQTPAQTVAGTASSTALVGTVTASASQIVITPGLVLAGPCNAGTWSGTLNRQ